MMSMKCWSMQDGWSASRKFFRGRSSAFVLCALVLFRSVFVVHRNMHVDDAIERKDWSNVCRLRLSECS